MSGQAHEPAHPPANVGPLALDCFKGRFNLGNNAVGILFVEVVPPLERRLPTAGRKAQPARLLLHALLGLRGGDDHERNVPERQETARPLTIRVHPVDVFGVPPTEGPRKLFADIPGRA
jgi:hypothetical protein